MKSKRRAMDDSLVTGTGGDDESSDLGWQLCCGSRRISPDVQHCVAAPRTPSLRHRFGLLRGNTAEIVANGDVFLGKCVGPAERSHGDVVRGPLADAG